MNMYMKVWVILMSTCFLFVLLLSCKYYPHYKSVVLGFSVSGWLFVKVGKVAAATLGTTILLIQVSCLLILGGGRGKSRTANHYVLVVFTMPEGTALCC